MAREYTKCDKDTPLVREKMEHLIEAHFPDLKECEVKIDLLFSSDKEGAAIVHRGRAVNAMTRQLSQKDRSKGMGDVEIVLDKEFWEPLSHNRKDALLHRELYRLQLKREDENGAIVRDPLGRPRFRFRAYDVEFSAFREVAKIYGRDSIELVQAEKMMLEDGQLFWPGVIGHKPGELGPVGKPKDGEDGE